MSPIKIVVVPVTPLSQNASVICCTKTNDMAVVDPGGDLDAIVAAAEQTGGTVSKILLTHGHIDHAGGAAELAERLDVPVVGPHRADQFLLDELPQHGSRFGIAARALTPSAWLDEGETVSIGALAFSVFHTPGHAPGHVVFVAADLGLVIGGDVLFAGSIGRSDFPYGDHDALIGSIRRVLLPLPDGVAVLPGHGPATTIGRERAANPFLVGG